jgi:hypothetical protein
VDDLATLLARSEVVVAATRSSHYAEAVTQLSPEQTLVDLVRLCEDRPAKGDGYHALVGWVLLLVENNAYPFDVRVRREAHALRDAGYRVSVIAPRASGQPWSERHDGINVHRFPAPPGGAGLLSYAFEFAYATLAMLVLSCWVALRRGVDVVHAANPPDTLFVIGALFRLAGVPFVFDHHDLAPETYLSRFGKPRRERRITHAAFPRALFLQGRQHRHRDQRVVGDRHRARREAGS